MVVHWGIKQTVLYTSLYITQHYACAAQGAMAASHDVTSRTQWRHTACIKVATSCHTKAMLSSTCRSDLCSRWASHLYIYFLLLSQGYLSGSDRLTIRRQIDVKYSLAFTKYASFTPHFVSRFTLLIQIKILSVIMIDQSWYPMSFLGFSLPDYAVHIIIGGCLSLSSSRFQYFFLLVATIISVP